MGPLRRQKVSKGFRVKVNFPQIPKKYILEMLEKNRMVDSWLLVVYRSGPKGTEFMGSVYIPFLIPGRTIDQPLRVRQLKQGTFQIFYAAAALSSRFEKASCPAFGHDKVIEKSELFGKTQNVGKMNVSSIEERRVLFKVDRFSLSPATFNGGSTLEGEYFVKLALFNSEKKMRLSSFYELPNKVKIGSEVRDRIKGCVSTKMPSKRDESKGSDTFKFGR